MEETCALGPALLNSQNLKTNYWGGRKVILLPRDYGFDYRNVSYNVEKLQWEEYRIPP